MRDVPARYPCRSLIRLHTILCEARRSSTRIYSTGTVPQCAYRQWRNEKPGAKMVWAQHHSMTRVYIAWTKVRIDGFSPLRERALKGSSLDVCARYATTLVDHKSPALRCKPGFSVVRKMNRLLLPRLNAGRTSEKIQFHDSQARRASCLQDAPQCHDVRCRKWTGECYE